MTRDPVRSATRYRVACRLSLLAIALSVAAAHTPSVALPRSASTAAKPPDRSQAVGCLIEPYRVVDVGSSVIGTLEQVHVDRGDRISKGQVLATLDSTVERAAVAVAISRVQALAEYRAAVAAAELAERNADRTQALFERSFVSDVARDQASAEMMLAAERVAQAAEQRALAAQELVMARAQLARRTIVSPLSGVVTERFLSPGERVEEKPILRLAQLDPLRVELILSATEFSRVRTGMVAVVHPDLPGVEPRNARVTTVDQVIDAASNTFRVRLTLPNPGGTLPSGLRCTVGLPD
jgi:RND family efflux transporter MFP subunit